MTTYKEVAYVTLKPMRQFVAGHLLQHVSVDKHYPVLSAHAYLVEICDDSGTTIQLTSTTRRKHFNSHLSHGST